jgi:SAM-dependent methyltransferase
MTYLLLPGRQIVNTRYQEEYLGGILGLDLETLPEMIGTAPAGRATNIVFAVTSCNKSNSRYNPLPFEIRSILVYEFARRLQEKFGVRFHVVGIPHYPPTPKFASLILKEIGEQSDNELVLTPSNTVVFTSTPPMIVSYGELGFAVLPGEYDPATKTFTAPVPNAVVQQIGHGEPWEQIPISRSTQEVFANFPDAPERIARLYHDPILTDQGDLTETRNYATYNQAMASAIDFKYAEIAPFLQPGKIVDEGCADGALIERIVPDFPDSDVLGIDLSAEMLARANEKKRAGAFGGAFVFFAQRNLMTPISDAQAGRDDTIICNSTLHELWSYGEGVDSVREYLRNKERQLRTGGRLVVRDVVGPPNGDLPVVLECSTEDGLVTDDWAVAEVGSLSTLSRFRRFCRDFREGQILSMVKEIERDGRTLFRLPLRAAMEFIAKMNYTDNWQSEMHEEFCFWDFGDWTRELADAGLRLVPGSHAYANAWRVEHDFAGRVRLYDEAGTLLSFPATNMVLVGEKLRL